MWILVNGKNRHLNINYDYDGIDMIVMKDTKGVDELFYLGNIQNNEQIIKMLDSSPINEDNKEEVEEFLQRVWLMVTYEDIIADCPTADNIYDKLFFIYEDYILEFRWYLFGNKTKEYAYKHYGSALFKHADYVISNIYEIPKSLLNKLKLMGINTLNHETIKKLINNNRVISII